MISAWTLAINSNLIHLLPQRCPNIAILEAAQLFPQPLWNSSLFSLVNGASTGNAFIEKNKNN